MLTEFAQYWVESFLWSVDLLWRSLWDQQTFFAFLVLWVALVLKEWNRIGWASASWKFLERGISAVKALFWPAIVLAGVLVIIVLFVAPARKYHELETKYQGLSSESTKPPKVIQDEDSMKTIGDLRQQLNERNIEIQELKRLKDKAEETASRSASDNAALNNKLRDLQGKLADKVARQTHREKLAAFLDTGEAIKTKCFSGLDTPRKEAVEWHDQILSYLKMTMDSSHVIRFKNTRSPNAKLHYFLPGGKPVAKECNDNAQDIDIKLDVLRDFLSELSK
ncbi:MAG: hypothetical protein ABIQ24_08610 [Nitrospiraceae bacterium]